MEQSGKESMKKEKKKRLMECSLRGKKRTTGAGKPGNVILKDEKKENEKKWDKKTGKNENSKDT